VVGVVKSFLGLDDTPRISLVDAVRRFQWVPKGAEPDDAAKPGMVAFMAPIVHGGFVPDSCLGNDQRFVEERMVNVKSVELIPDKFMMQCMNEFAEFLIPDEHEHHLAPTEYEEVYARQCKPSQRLILEEAEHGNPNDRTQQFMKREAYGTVTDPRGISTINGVTKREYSRFMYAFTDAVMKRQKWYAFGMTPREVAERVVEVVAGARKACMKDFSRMDGRHSNVLNLLERICYLRAFRQEFHSQLLALMSKHHHLRARSTFGVTFSTEWQRLSGGADTSVGNTLDTAFIAYYTYRMMWLEPAEAWVKLGIYGGDDGLDTDVEVSVARKAASRVGQVLEIDVVDRGQPGVMFLARRYGPDVWYGDANSCCDLKRQLSKFHLTVALDSKVTPVQKLQEKTLSFLQSDANSPVFDIFLAKAYELYPLKKTEFQNRLNLWHVEMDVSKQYPNERADWMDDYARESLGDFDFDRFAAWVASCDGTTIFMPPVFADPIAPKPKQGKVSFEGDLLVTGEEAGSSAHHQEPRTKASDKPKFRPRKPKAERKSRKQGSGPERSNPVRKG